MFWFQVIDLSSEIYVLSFFFWYCVEVYSFIHFYKGIQFYSFSFNKLPLVCAILNFYISLMPLWFFFSFFDFLPGNWSQEKTIDEGKAEEVEAESWSQVRLPLLPPFPVPDFHSGALLVLYCVVMGHNWKLSVS
jgi:hypothetical protein